MKSFIRRCRCTSTAASPAIRPGRNELESVNRPVTIGGVLVRPGDVVMADGDGVVVVPRERAVEVANAALPFLDNIARERYIRNRTEPLEEGVAAVPSWKVQRA